MLFPAPLIHGTLVKRYKRFLADVRLDNGDVVVAHTTNTGSMRSCIEIGAEVYLTFVDDPKRKTKYTWEMININNSWIGVNTLWPNYLVYELIKGNEMPGIDGYTKVLKEVKYRDSRFDIFCEKENEKCYVEVKNVTLKIGNTAKFPDAVTTRGQKHLKTLMQVKKEGNRGVMLYVVQRGDVCCFEPAREIDNEYAELLAKAYQSGVEIIVMQATVNPQGIHLTKKLPFKI